MVKDDLLYLAHMRDIASKAVEMAAGVSRAEYDRNEGMQFALSHLVQTLGEAARHVSSQFRDQHPNIAWGLMIGMRHRIVHDYMSVDYGIVWDTIAVDLRPLLAELDKLVPPPPVP